ncbi:hypothetical protein JTE90_017553 [Oedothorax gibbosus]|uniref:Uncharacterized protein n=1 Tax=Oedothorax gibbosus TaxID=931172 RepID=A0AAV6UMU4_9ARAC|nr:hypothetical protein JTE90_017553 [Oedothorax gibbosus]
MYNKRDDNLISIEAKMRVISYQAETMYFPSLSAQKVNVSRDQLLESASKLPCECAEGGRNLLGALQKAYVLGKVHMAALTAVDKVRRRCL